MIRAEHDAVAVLTIDRPEVLNALDIPTLGLSDETMEGLAARHPLGLGTPGDLAGAFVYLASDDARWTSGSALVVDGGYSLP